MEPILIIMECTWVLLNSQEQQLLVSKSEIKKTENLVTYLKVK